MWEWAAQCLLAVIGISGGVAVAAGLFSPFRRKSQAQAHPGSVTSGQQLRHWQVMRPSMVFAKPAYSANPAGLQGCSPRFFRVRACWTRHSSTRYSKVSP